GREPAPPSDRGRRRSSSACAAAAGSGGPRSRRPDRRSAGAASVAPRIRPPRRGDAGRGRVIGRGGGGLNRGRGGGRLLGGQQAVAEAGDQRGQRVGLLARDQDATVRHVAQGERRHRVVAHQRNEGGGILGGAPQAIGGDEQQRRLHLARSLAGLERHH